MTLRKIWVISMFENYFDSFLDSGIIGSTFRNERGDGVRFEFKVIHLPTFSKKGFKGVDDSPFGGGVGMIMRPDILEKALVEGIHRAGNYTNTLKDDLHVICPLPRGRAWDNDYAKSFALQHLGDESDKDLVFVCGRYEGIDERFLDQYVDEYISMGDFILTGGELAVMTILDSAMRFSPGVLGNKLSNVDESFAGNYLEHALYTRPQVFNSQSVPDELISGDPKKILKFKEKSSISITQKYRPDLLDNK